MLSYSAASTWSHCTSICKYYHREEGKEPLFPTLRLLQILVVPEHLPLSVLPLWPVLSYSMYNHRYKCIGYGGKLLTNRLWMSTNVLTRRSHMSTTNSAHSIIQQNTHIQTPYSTPTQLPQITSRAIHWLPLTIIHTSSLLFPPLHPLILPELRHSQNPDIRSRYRYLTWCIIPPPILCIS